MQKIPFLNALCSLPATMRHTLFLELAAMFIETEERQIERDLMREIGALRAEVRSLRGLLEATSTPQGPRNSSSI